MAPAVEYFTFFTLMEESILFLPKNGTLMSAVALSSFLLCSSFFLVSKYSLQSAVKYMHVTVRKFLIPDLISSPHNSVMLETLSEYMALVPTDEIIFFLGISVIIFFLGIATILIFATSYTHEMFSLRRLLSAIGKTCGRTLVTTLYLSGLLLGYLFGIGALAAAVFILFPTPFATSVATLIGLPVLVLSFYLSVSWIMAIVVSVVEENCYGGDALRRAAALVEDIRSEGFMLYFCYSILAFILPHGLRMMLGHMGMVDPMIYGVLLVNLSVLLKLWLLLMYTTFYFHCRMFRGEIILLDRSV